MEDQIHVICGRVVIVIMKTVDRHIVRVRRPDRGGRLIHLFRKMLRRPAQSLGDRDGRVVPGGKDHSVEGLLQTDLISGPKTGHRRPFHDTQGIL